jgi:hypothetical protein
MRNILAEAGGLAVLAVLATTPAHAQPAPPGSYQLHCRDIQMNGPFLSATCRGERGGGQSSINVQSCAGDIGVDPTGALSCTAPGVGPGGYNPGPLPPGVGDPRPRPGYRPPRDDFRGGAITVYSRKNWQGRSQPIDGAIANLAGLGLNDAIRSIRLDRRSGPWIVCVDANFRGRCTRVDGDLADTRWIGMDRAISSLRPAG